MNHSAIIEPEPLDELLNGELGLTTVRPVPRSEEWYRAQAEEQVGDLYRDTPGVRELRIRELMDMGRQIDRAYCNNARVA